MSIFWVGVGSRKKSIVFCGRIFWAEVDLRGNIAFYWLIFGEEGSRLNSVETLSVFGEEGSHLKSAESFSELIFSEEGFRLNSVEALSVFGEEGEPFSAFGEEGSRLNVEPFSELIFGAGDFRLNAETFFLLQSFLPLAVWDIVVSVGVHVVVGVASGSLGQPVWLVRY